MFVIEPSSRGIGFRLCRYGVRVGDAVSQLINVVVFLSDNPNESLSGRSYRQKRHWFWGKMHAFIDLLFYPFHIEHCKKAHEADIARATQLLKGAV